MPIFQYAMPQGRGLSGLLPFGQPIAHQSHPKIGPNGQQSIVEIIIRSMQCLAMWPISAIAKKKEAARYHGAELRKIL